MATEQSHPSMTEAEVRGFAAKLVAWAGTLEPTERALLSAIVWRGAPAAATDDSAGYTLPTPPTERGDADDVVGFFFYDFIKAAMPRPTYALGRIEPRFPAL